MRNKNEILARIKELREERDKYTEAFDKGNFSEAAVNNFSHINARIEELGWVLVTWKPIT